MIKRVMTTRILITAMTLIASMLVTVRVNAEETLTGISLEAADTDGVLRTQMADLVLKASDMEDLYTLQMEISYDPGRLSLDQEDITNLAWNINQSGYAAISIASEVGRVKIIYSQKGKKPGVSGDRDLIGLSFEALRIGRTTVEVSNIMLINSQGNIIRATTAAVSKEIDVKPNPLLIELTGEKGQEDWFVSPVTIEIIDLDAKEISYSLDGIRHDYTQPFSMSEIGRHNLKVTTDDGYGYIKEKEEILKIDYESPLITVNNQNYDWQNSDIIIMPEFDDGNGSGIMRSMYQWSNTADEPAQWEEYDQGVLTLATEGIWYLHANAVDIAGNTSQTVFGPYRLDKTAPLSSVDCDKREAWENTDINVTPTFTDEGGSQLKYMGYQWSFTQSVPPAYTPYTSGSLQQTNDGVWYLHLVVEDMAGNVTADTFGPYRLDKTAPIIDADMQGRDWGYTDICVMPVFMDEGGSQIESSSYQWSPDQTEPAEYTPFTSDLLMQSEEGVWYLHMKAEDVAGNSRTVTFGPYKLDKTIPVITVDIQEREWESTDVTITPAFTDEGGSQLKYMGYQWSLQSVPYTYTPYTSGSLLLSNEGAWYLHLTVEDGAGNTKAMTYGPYKIDRSVPVIDFIGVTEGMNYTDTVTPIIYITDAVSGIKTQTLLLDGQAYMSGTPVTGQGTHIITAFGEDYSGNTTTKSIFFKVYASTYLTLNSPLAEYSDAYTISASLTSYGQAVSGAAITIRINGADMGTYYTDAQGNAILSGIAHYNAGYYTVDAIYLQDDLAYYRAAQCGSALMVTTESNSLIYTGSTQVQYPGTFTISAQVLQENDGYPGDMSLARLNVDIIRQNTDGTSTLTDSFIIDCDANGAVTLDLNYGLGAYSVYITILPDGFYTPGASYITIPVYQDCKDSVSCGGWLNLPDPSTGEPVQVTCNFNIKYKSGGADGTFKLFYDEAGLNIHNGNITWLVVDGNTAQFEGYDGTYTYRLACIDEHNTDYITLRIWYGTDTSAPPALEVINQAQDGGNINVKEH